LTLSLENLSEGLIYQGKKAPYILRPPLIPTFPALLAAPEYQSHSLARLHFLRQP
jgi:hypothetical protein